MIKLGQFIDLTGQKFGRLTVIERGENGKNGGTRWQCRCDCGNEKLTLTQSCNLRSGKTKSCGCLQREIASKSVQIKQNTYDLSGDYGVGYTSNKKEFWFDLDDYERIKMHCWYANNQGYVQSRINKKIIGLHRFVLNVDNPNVIVDHIGHVLHDNRKINLRIVDISQNQMNKKRLSNNKSGTTGVSFHKQSKKWRAYIDCRGEQIYLGVFSKKKDAILSRRDAESKLHGNYSYEESLKKYNEVVCK